MPFNFYDTHTLLMAVQQLTPAATFLRDRYFPTNDASDIFATDDVLVEFRDGSKKLAPFVAPRKGGVTVLRAGYNMERYTPPFVAPRRVLTLDELRKRGFGEALYSQLTPEQRQQTLILRDADELGELITNREEAMAAETMLTNGCVMKHIADDVDKADEMEIRFYSEASNPATYTPTAKWDATGGKILKDLEAMIRMLTKRGLRASDLVCSPDVADTIINDAAVQKLLDNRRIEIGKVEPELLPDGAAIVAHLNVLGRIISVISYDLTYTDDESCIITLRAYSAPQSVKDKRSKSWEKVKFLQLAQEIAGRHGLTLETYGITDQTYDYVEQNNLADFTFFQNRCTLEGAAFLVYDGKLVVYDEARMESQQPVDTITITPANDFEYRDEGTNAYGSAEAVNGGLTGTFTAPSGGDKVLRRILPFRMTDQSEADRFAKGLLRDANKNATVGTLWTGSLLRDYAAGSVVTLATEGVKSWDGTAFISRIRHDYVKTRSKLYLRKPLEGY